MPNVKILTCAWVLSLMLCAFTILSLGWVFWVSLAVFCLCCGLMERDKQYYEAELDQWLGKGDELR